MTRVPVVVEKNVFHNKISQDDKSGKHTYGLGKFYDSKKDKAIKGLEISTISIVDVDYNTAYPVSTRQTSVIDDPNKTRMDWYALWPTVCYLAHDGFYQKVKFLEDKEI